MTAIIRNSRVNRRPKRVVGSHMTLNQSNWSPFAPLKNFSSPPNALCLFHPDQSDKTVWSDISIIFIYLRPPPKHPSTQAGVI